MNIHEYQTTELPEEFVTTTTREKEASTPEEAERFARQLGILSAE